MNNLILVLVICLAILPTIAIVVTHFVMRRKQVEVAETVVVEVVSKVGSKVTEQARQLDHIEHLVDSAATEQQKRIDQLVGQLTDANMVPDKRAPAPPSPPKPSSEEPNS